MKLLHKVQCVPQCASSNLQDLSIDLSHELVKNLNSLCLNPPHSPSPTLVPRSTPGTSPSACCTWTGSWQLPPVPPVLPHRSPPAVTAAAAAALALLPLMLMMPPLLLLLQSPLAPLSGAPPFPAPALPASSRTHPPARLSAVHTGVGAQGTKNHQSGHCAMLGQGAVCGMRPRRAGNVESSVNLCMSATPPIRPTCSLKP